MGQDEFAKRREVDKDAIWKCGQTVPAQVQLPQVWHDVKKAAGELSNVV